MRMILNKKFVDIISRYTEACLNFQTPSIQLQSNKMNWPMNALKASPKLKSSMKIVRFHLKIDRPEKILLKKLSVQQSLTAKAHSNVSSQSQVDHL
jgi:hypothetical protein